MPTVNAQKIIDKRKKEAAAKAAATDVVKGDIPISVIDELVAAKERAKDLSAGFGEAVKAQAAKYGIKPAALRKFVTAREADKVDELEAEQNDIEKLIEHAQD